MKSGFKTKNKVLGINLFYLISLIPIILFSFYKNGYLVYKLGYINFVSSLQYLVIPLVIIVLSYVFEVYYYLGIKKEENNDSVVNSIVPYINTLCYLVCGPTDKLWICIPLIIVLDIIMKFLDNKISFNRVALFSCLLFGVLTVLGQYNNCNNYELTLETLNFNVKDLFIGKGIGGIGTTSALLSLVSYVILLFNSYYKKDIPFMAFVGYAIICLIIYFIGGYNLNEILINTFSSGFIFASVFVASLSTGSPVAKSGRIIYGFLFGVFSAIVVNAFKFNIGIYFIIFVLSLFIPLFNKYRLSVD